VGELRRALGPNSGLAVQSATDHRDRQRALSRQGLERLTQITTLIMAGAVLAMAAAMGTMFWQRRPRLAMPKLEGFTQRELWRTVLLESVLLLGAGCVSGAVFGLYGQRLLDKALASVVNFPVTHTRLRAAGARGAGHRARGRGAGAVAAGLSQGPRGARGGSPGLRTEH
jgi:putative ABC transport system permease protein